MAGQQSAKGNPATHRMGNPRRKARRAECWARGQKRKLARKKEADEAQKFNAGVVAGGGMTPWQRAKALRAERREQKRQAA